MKKVFDIVGISCLVLLAVGALTWFPEIASQFKGNPLWPFLYGIILIILEVCIILRYGPRSFHKKARFVHSVGFLLGLEAIRVFIGVYGLVFGVKDTGYWYLTSLSVILGMATALIPSFIAVQRYRHLHGKQEGNPTAVTA